MPIAATKDKNKAAISRERRVYRPGSERREEIIAAAQTAFVRSSFSGARTRDIAEAAGVNQATLFKHFPTKEALFEEAVIKPLLDAMGNMYGSVEVYQTADTPAQMAEMAERSTAQHLEKMQAILPLLVTALFSDLRRGKALFGEHLDPLIRQRGEVLRPLVKHGMEPEFVGLATFGMMFAVAMQNWFAQQATDWPAIAAQFNRFATGGFARENGQ